MLRHNTFGGRMSNPFIRKLERFGLLSEADKEILLSVTTKVRRVGAQQDLISEGDPTDGVHLIQKGFACRYKVLPEGARSIMAYLVPGDLCDLHVAVLGRMDHSIATLSACEVITLSREVIEEITVNYPAINRALWWSVLVDEAILREWLVSMGRRSAEQRIAHLLCELLVRLQAVGLAVDNSYDLPITQADLADTTGLSTVHTNRVLQELRRHELIVFKNRSVNILDIERLKARAQFAPNYLHLEPKRPNGRSQSRDGYGGMIPPI